MKGRERWEEKYFKNFIRTMSNLYDENAEKEWIEVGLRLFAWMILSGLFFPRTPYRVTWFLERYVTFVTPLNEFACLEAILRFPV